MKNQLKENSEWMMWVAIVAFLSGIGVFGYQTFTWLKYGYWESISVLYPFYTYGNSAWAAYPDTWIGLHKSLEIIPLSLALVILGIILLVKTENYN